MPPPSSRLGRERVGEDRRAVVVRRRAARRRAASEPSRHVALLAASASRVTTRRPSGSSTTPKPYGSWPAVPGGRPRDRREEEERRVRTDVTRGRRRVRSRGTTTLPGTGACAHAAQRAASSAGHPSVVVNSPGAIGTRLRHERGPYVKRARSRQASGCPSHRGRRRRRPAAARVGPKRSRGKAERHERRPASTDGRRSRGASRSSRSNARCSVVRVVPSLSARAPRAAGSARRAGSTRRRRRAHGSPPDPSAIGTEPGVVEAADDQDRRPRRASRARRGGTAHHAGVVRRLLTSRSASVAAVSCWPASHARR